MKRRIRMAWYNKHDPNAAWDACEVQVETDTHILSLCPFVGEVAGDEGRWIHSVDVPNGRAGLRSLAHGFASSRKAAIAAVRVSINAIVRGPAAVKTASTRREQEA
ncbi:UNVERIFIED_ORG: hypothetical protein GGI61_002499 [Rhizobium esperanzae]